MMRFQPKATPDKHAPVHLVGCFLLTVLFWWILGFWFTSHVAQVAGYLLAWGCGFGWEVWDGFKPDWRLGLEEPYWKQMLFYSDGFSWFDILTNTVGCVAGLVAVQQLLGG